MKLYGKRFTSERLLELLGRLGTITAVAEHIGERRRTISHWYQDIRGGVVNEKVKADIFVSIAGDKLLNLSNRNVLFMTDTHYPYNRKGCEDFCKEIYDKEECDLVIMGGDLVDLHSTSRHMSDPDLPNSKSELEKAVECCERLFSIFPEGILTLGNHDLRIIRKATGSGISRSFLKTFEQVYKIPEEWKVVEHVMVDGIIYQHGNDLSGDNAATTWTMKNLCSTAIGHVHSVSSIKYLKSAKGMYLAISCGCLADQSALSMAYSKSYPRRFVNGVTVIKNGTHAQFFPMP